MKSFLKTKKIEEMMKTLIACLTHKNEREKIRIEIYLRKYKLSK